ncbi:hypothetical protein BSKO_08648 [Bryopsis sp. KO-2023]|nr:hypothetical protein BSKO_08648 [Bryopsis sp. KO-2023]
MGLSKEEIDIQCDWAGTLAVGSKGRDDAHAIVRACLSGRKGSRKSNGESAASNASKATSAVNGSEFLCLLPICKFLQESGGLYADVLVPEIVAHLEHVCNFLHLPVEDSTDPVNASQFQSAVATLLQELTSVLRGQVLGSEDVRLLSRGVHNLVMKCLSPERELPHGFNVCYCIIRVLSRNQKLQNGLPLIPSHANEILDWLRVHYYKEGSRSGDEDSGVSENGETQAIVHIDQEKILALTLPIISSTFPVASSSHEEATGAALMSTPVHVDESTLHQIVSFSCDAARLALRPLLQSAVCGDSLSEAPTPENAIRNRPKSSPSAAVVRSASRLASHLVTRLWKASDKESSTPMEYQMLKEEVSKVLNMMLEVSEACLKSTWECGVDNVLGIATHMLYECMELTAASARFGGNPMNDILSRLRSLMMSSARLIEDHAQPETEAASSQGSFRSRTSLRSMAMADCDVACGWDVSQKFTAHSINKVEDPASPIALCQVATEALCCTLAAGWKAGHRKTVRDIAVPLGNKMMTLKKADLTTCAERQVATMALGRLFVLVDGDPEMARLLLPLLINGMLGSEKAPTQVYACLVHVMATIGGVSGQKKFLWGHDQVVEQLIKLYKDPRAAGCSGLMYVSGTKDSCKGAMADAILQMTKLCQKGPESIRRELRLKLLALFSDFGLKASEHGVIYDLGALLPAIAASCEGLDKSFYSMLENRGNNSFRSLEPLHRDRQLIKHFRIFWIYTALYKFVGLTGAKENPWPVAWRTALGQIATSTPALIAIEGPNRTDEMQETLRAELKDRLESAGSAANPEYLEELLKETVAPYGGILTVPPQWSALTPYLLAVATVELCRAALGALPCGDDPSPLVSIMAHISAVPSTSVEAPWYGAIARKVFEFHIDRLKSSMGVCFAGAIPGENVDFQLCQERLAEVLITNVAAQSGQAVGGLPEVAEVSSELLKKLLEACPSLIWSHKCLNKLMTSLEQEEAANVMMGGESRDDHGLVWQWAVAWIDAAATAAPARAEALLQEHLRVRGHTLDEGTLRRAGDLLAVCSSARQKKSPAVHIDTSNDFMRALSRKSYYVGRVSGFQDALHGKRDGMGSSMAEGVVDMLEKGLQEQVSKKDLEELYLQAVATLLLCEDSKVPHRLLRSICWVPVKRFGTDMMKMATFSWEWLATGSPGSMVRLLGEVVDAWLWTVQRNLGLFSRTKSEQDASADAKCLEGINAHTLWLSFLLEQWELVRNEPSTGAFCAIYGRLLQQSLGDPSVLSHHPAAAGALFKLLTLGLRYCEFCLKDHVESVSAAVLYERIIKAGLTWFECPPAWYGGWTRTENEEEALAVDVFESILNSWEDNLDRKRIAPVLASVWGGAGWEPLLGRQRKELLLHLCQAEIHRLKVWACPLPNADPNRQRTETTSDWQRLTRVAWAVDPKMALSMSQRFLGVQAIISELFTLVSKNISDPAIQALPMAAMIITTCDSIRRMTVQGKYDALRHWAPATTANALMLMSSDAAKHSAIKEYAVKSLRNVDPEELAFYLPQLVQCLREDGNHILEDFLRTVCHTSRTFCHRLLWYLRSEFKPPSEAFNPAIKRSGWKPPGDTGLWGHTERVYGSILASLDTEEKAFTEAETVYFDKVTNISEELFDIAKDERRAKIAEELRKIELPRKDLYLPTNPDARVLESIPESGTPMPSKEKMPILVQFAVQEHHPEGYRLCKQACIFKVGDDVRQDVLALQVIKILGDAFQKAGLDLYLCPYGVIPTDYEKGIIEVVPNSKSRSALGETTDGGLYEIFQREFGAPGNPQFESARREFMRSEAGYCVASYLLQCKDRHNGNILIDSEGHIVHIDFGFILEISPGGNMKFEAADFKLSHEMAQLVDPGGMMTSHLFHQFEELCIRGFLAARTVADPIMACVALMKNSGLPCYIGKAVDNMLARLHLDKTEAQVAAMVKDMIKSSYCHWTTGFYDKIQNYTY